MDRKKKFTNHLVHESSPYLQQHMHNPVDWYPWGEEAFAKAKKMDRPIFLSIGYATCHWCHVMEQESFSNHEIGRLMNTTFVNIKVDREERPEVDGLYMEFAQGMLQGAGGWPLNLILTPDLIPFFASTYLPPENRAQMLGLKELCERIASIWSSDARSETLEQASRLLKIFKKNLHHKGDTFPQKDYITQATTIYFHIADPSLGGVAGAPKFPSAYQITFLIYNSILLQEGRSLFLAEKTLEMMRKGGIYDQLGGGFSRYSVDERWEIPHFEKMLYDNALIASAYLCGWQATRHELFSQTVIEILDYVLREMTHPKGGFFSAEDADSEGEEGKYYIWTKSEIDKVLKEDSENFCRYFNIKEKGNFEGKNVLHSLLDMKEFSHPSFDLERCKKKLLLERQKRVPPFKDDKIICAWNGLMIFSLAHAGVALKEKRYVEAALKGATFLRSNLTMKGQLIRCWRNGSGNLPSDLDGYAFTIRAALALFQIGQGTKWLKWAIQLATTLSNEFKAEGGAFYMTDCHEPYLILRKCQFSDAAEPSGNAIHCENLLTLYQLTGDPNYLMEGEDILKSVKKYFDIYPLGYLYHIRNLQRYYDRKAPHFIFSGEQDREEILRRIYSRCLPHKTVTWIDDELIELFPHLAKYRGKKDQITLHLCSGQTCEKAISGSQKIIERITSF